MDKKSMLSRINKIQNEGMRETALYMLLNEDCSTLEIANNTGVDSDKAGCRIQYLVKNHGAQIMFEQFSKPKGGAMYRYKLVGFGSGYLSEEGSKMKPEYTRSQFVDAFKKLDSQVLEETLITLDRLSCDYESIHFIAKQLECSVDTVRRRIHVLQKKIPGMLIHRHGGMKNTKYRLVSLSKHGNDISDPVANNTQSENNFDCLLNAVFSQEMVMNKKDYVELLEYCRTDRQREIFETLIETGNQKETSELVGLNTRGIRRMVDTVKGYRAEVDTEPHDIHMGELVPNGYEIKGVSTMVTNVDGKPVWVKTQKKQIEEQNAMLAYVDALKTELPRVEPTKEPETNAPNLLNQYTITDYHLGMMAWHEETGDDWDIKIAEALLIKWVESAMAMSPDADNAILANIGDFMHWDGMEAVTPAHRNILDADTRFSKLARIASRCLVTIIKMLLEKHKHVHVIMCDANHDPASEAWFRAFLPLVFESEPRVSFDESPSPYNAYQFGEVGLFYHHGHKRKPKNIDTVFVRQFREIFGTTKHCYAHMGHLHNDNVIESNLMVVEQHRTLASADAYAAGGGWLSGRSAKVITYHKKYGEVARNTITPEMLGF